MKGLDVKDIGALDLKEFPDIEAIAEHAVSAMSTLVIPDIHGNTLLILVRLLAVGIIRISQDKIKEAKQLWEGKPAVKDLWRDLYDAEKGFSALNELPLVRPLVWDKDDHFSLTVDKRDQEVGKKNTAVAEILLGKLGKFLDLCEFPATKHSILFLGDMIGDRAFGGESVFIVLKALADHGIPYKIIFGNHDVVAYGVMKQLDKEASRPNIQMYEGMVYNLHQYFGCAQLIAMWPFLSVERRRKILDLYQQYFLPRVVLFAYEQSDGQLMIASHAPATVSRIIGAAKDLGFELDDKNPAVYTHDGLMRLMEFCNLKFSEYLLKPDTVGVLQLLGYSDFATKDSAKRCQSIWELLYGRVVFKSKSDKNRYEEANARNKLSFVFGHLGADDAIKGKSYVCIDSSHAGKVIRHEPIRRMGKNNGKQIVLKLRDSFKGLVNFLLKGTIPLYFADFEFFLNQGLQPSTSEKMLAAGEAYAAVAGSPVSLFPDPFPVDVRPGSLSSTDASTSESDREAGEGGFNSEVVTTGAPLTYV